MLRKILGLVLAGIAACAVAAATLEFLPLDRMARKSTAIIRGRVTGATTLKRGAILYTLWQVEVLERWKGATAGQISVAIPGGEASGLRQTFSGAPQPVEGGEYVFFLWAGQSGLNQVIGLSQGLFGVQRDADGVFALRAASSETMLDSAGHPVRDESVRVALVDLKEVVRKALE